MPETRCSLLAARGEAAPCPRADSESGVLAQHPARGRAGESGSEKIAGGWVEVGPGGGGEGFLEAPSPTFGAASPEEEGTLIRRRSHQKTTPSRCAPAGPRLCWGGGEGGPGSSVDLGRSPSGQPICGGRFVAVVRSFLPSQTLSLVGGKKLRCTKNKCDPSSRSRPRSWGQRQRARPGPTAARLPHTALPGPGKRPKPRSSGVVMRDTGGVRSAGRSSARAHSQGKKPSAPEPPHRAEKG